MKYGNAISMWPSSASSFSTISRSIAWKVWTVISRSCSSRISTKRDMCVPLKWCGRHTYMLKVATVCCTPPPGRPAEGLSCMRMGWRIALTPTLSIASLRESGVAWTSAMLCRSRAFIAPILLGERAPDRLLDARGIEPHRRKQPARVAVIDEAVGQPEEQHLGLASQDLAHCGARAAHHLVLFDGDEKLVRSRELPHHVDIERLHEAHVHDRGVEGLPGLERSFEHRA